jgi:hypothetical protein
MLRESTALKGPARILTGGEGEGALYFHSHFFDDILGAVEVSMLKTKLRLRLMIYWPLIRLRQNSISTPEQLQAHLFWILSTLLLIK